MLLLEWRTLMPPDSTSALAALKEWLSLPETIIGILVGLATLATAFFTKVLPWWRTKRDRRLLENNLDGSLYTKAVIERSTQHYVDPLCQVLDPAGAEEPRNLAFNPTKDLFQVIDAAFTQSTEYRYLILLADSGMGKTSFLLNYFARYLRKGTCGFTLQLVPLGIPDADARIAQIQNKNKTVLLLDALDEDTLAIVDHAARLRDLVKLTREFQKVLITCRTQFFPKEEEIPKETGVVKVGPLPAGETRQYLFHKLYLSPFSNEQVREYLKKRYPLWRLGRRKQAEGMVQKIPNLSVRPMLLAHVDDLVQANRVVNYSFELYEEMVAAWLEREEGIFSNLKQEPLRQFSERLAVDLYLNRERRGAERIPRSELAGLAKQWHIPLDEWQLSGRSLLNRDAEGNYKFAHRSIMEYLFVKKFFEGERAPTKWTDQMKAFLVEVVQSHINARKPFPSASLDLSGLWLSLRSKPLANLHREEVTAVLKLHGFFDKYWNEEGQGVSHRYEMQDSEGEKIVLDHATGLMWQQSGTSDYITFAKAEEYVREMNRKRFAGFSDWRLPTLEEAMSLMEREKKNGDLYLDSVFDRMQRWIWTADKSSASSCWVVNFRYGHCGDRRVDLSGYVRLVR
jgi:hypothetical protein